MNYYDMLNESFKKMLLEAKQDEINFANVFGAELKDRFKAQKQRLKSPQNDFYYWIRMSRDEGLEQATSALTAALTELENKATRSQKRKKAIEGADILYDDNDWIVLKINTYEAAQKYGAGSVWCITGRYPGHEGRGQEYFNNYKNQHGWDYYFYIKKDGRDLEGRQKKWCLCWDGDLDSEYEIWRGDERERSEDRVSYIPDAPHIEGLPPVWEPQEEEEEEDDIDVDWDEVANDDEERQERPAPQPREPEFDLIDIENPNDFEFPARTKEEAVTAFKDGAEIIDSLNDTLHIAHWNIGAGEPDENGEIHDTGDRYCLFVFFPGQGGGPLLAQTGNGFGLQAFKNLDAVRNLARNIGLGDIRNNANDIDAAGMPECLQENFWYYDDGSWYYDI